MKAIGGQPDYALGSVHAVSRRQRLGPAAWLVLGVIGLAQPVVVLDLTVRNQR